MFEHIHGNSKLIMTLEKELVEPSSVGSLERLSFNVRLNPSRGGSRICTTDPYAAFIASIAPAGSPLRNTVSGGGVGKETEISTMCGFFMVTCIVFLVNNPLELVKIPNWVYGEINHLNVVPEVIELGPMVVQLHRLFNAAQLKIPKR